MPTNAKSEAQRLFVKEVRNFQGNYTLDMQSLNFHLSVKTHTVPSHGAPPPKMKGITVPEIGHPLSESWLSLLTVTLAKEISFMIQSWFRDSK